MARDEAMRERPLPAVGALLGRRGGRAGRRTRQFRDRGIRRRPRSPT